MRDMLPPLFQIGTGLAFLLVLMVGLGARQAIKRIGMRLMALSLLGVAAGMFFLSEATDATSIGAGGSMFVAAGVAFLISGVLVAIGLTIEARSARQHG
jgi:hypothetical protein